MKDKNASLTLKVGDKVRIHPEIQNFNKHEYPTITDDMVKFAGEEGTIIEVCPADRKDEPTVYSVHVGPSFWYFREEWLIKEDNIEISINFKDIQNLLL